MKGGYASVSRPRWSEASRCRWTGRVRHQTRAEARKWNRLHPEDRHQVYQCSKCGTWHLERPHWDGGRRQPGALCDVDPSPTWGTREETAAECDRVGEGAFPAPCGDHWHVAVLPAL